MTERDARRDAQDQDAELGPLGPAPGDDDEVLHRGPNNGGECPSCGRIMSVREGAEQGACNDCTDASGITRPSSADLGWR
jgi:hypothetical protein